MKVTRWPAPCEHPGCRNPGLPLAKGIGVRLCAYHLEARKPRRKARR